VSAARLTPATAPRPGIANPRAILSKTIKKIEGELKKARKLYAGLRQGAAVIKRGCEVSGRELPFTKRLKFNRAKDFQPPRGHFPRPAHPAEAR
jgi:hypothetical protein